MSKIGSGDSGSLDSLLLPSIFCNNIFLCETKEDEWKVLIASLLITKLLSTLLVAGSFSFSFMLREKKSMMMHKNLFKHTLNQEMAFFDSRTVGDIQSAMDPTSIINIIASVPALIGGVFKFGVFIFYLLKINISLTVLSLLSMAIFFMILRPILGVSFSPRIKKIILILKLSTFYLNLE